MIDFEIAFVSICLILFVSTLLIAFSFRKKKMGIDVYSGKGVIADSDEVVRFVNGKNKKIVIQTCQEWYDGVVDEYKNDPSDWRQQVVTDFEGIDKISTKATIAEVRRALRSVIKVGGEVAKYGECYVKHDEYLMELFNKLFEACDLGLPYLDNVTAFGSPRYNGWDVPLGVACFVFSSDDCFVRSLSEQGENLQKMIGHCNETEWTEMSY
jgi:hypothetical protein